ncbi:MAG: cytochrome c oxidase assembly protein [Robiginitomaculum sp.]|nr:MAG: cytochrome c oxidase assembly protein [Robiginitomaculum sp.]
MSLQDTSTSTSSHRKTVMILAVVAVAMLGLGFASKPLYDTFCKVTGYAGTTRVATVKSTTVLEREITVRFDANTRDDLAWTFKPEVVSMKVKIGQNVLAFYTAKNDSSVAVVGTASYNVTPIKSAPYFSKLECFCFTEQRLEPGEEVRMPVLFFVDPLMVEDKRLDEIKTITLSYTFHNVENPGEGAYTQEDREKRLKDIQSVDLSQ